MRRGVLFAVTVGAIALLAPATHAAGYEGEVGVPPEEASTPDPEPEVRVEPKSIVRTAVTTVEWVGGSPPLASDWFPRVTVERMRGPGWISWATEAHEGTGELRLADEGDSVWSARWQPAHDTPEGDYRIRIEGSRQGPDGVTDYELVSRDFTVTACFCVTASPLRARRRRGAWRLSVVGRYDLGPIAGFRLLPVRVQSGRAVVRVLRDGRDVKHMRLRYRSGAFRGTWRGPRGARDEFVFELVSLKDRFGNF